MKVKIKNWHAVALWKWTNNDDVCGICRNKMEGCCPTCTVPGDDCTIELGHCQHVFHLHCIQKWVSTKPQCPMCRREWVT